MNTTIPITILIFFITAGVFPAPCIAQETDKPFYDINLSQDMDIWKIREKPLTVEEKTELDKHVELLSEVRLKEKRARETLAEAQRKLSAFISGRNESIEKEKIKLRDEIARAQRKAARTQEKLDMEKQEAELLATNFDASIAKAQEALDKQQQKLEESLKKEQDNLALVQGKKKDVSEKISDFKRGIEEKFKK